MSTLRHKCYVNIPPKKVLNTNGSILGHARSGTYLREIQASSRDHIATTEVDIVMFKRLDIVETTRRRRCVNKRREVIWKTSLLEYHLSIRGSGIV